MPLLLAVEATTGLPTDCFLQRENSLARWWYPTPPPSPEKWASPSALVSTETVRSFLRYRARASWLNWYVFFVWTALSAVRVGGGTLYQLPTCSRVLTAHCKMQDYLHHYCEFCIFLWRCILQRSTQHFNLQVPSLCYGDISAIAFHTVYSKTY